MPKQILWEDQLNSINKSISFRINVNHLRVLKFETLTISKTWNVKKTHVHLNKPHILCIFLFITKKIITEWFIKTIHSSYSYPCIFSRKGSKSRNTKFTKKHLKKIFLCVFLKNKKCNMSNILTFLNKININVCFCF